MEKVSLALATLILLGGCSTAGPYVTNVSSDGDSGLNIEKCKVHFNSFTGVVSTGECTTQNLHLTE